MLAGLWLSVQSPACPNPTILTMDRNNDFDKSTSAEFQEELRLVEKEHDERINASYAMSLIRKEEYLDNDNIYNGGNQMGIAIEREGDEYLRELKKIQKENKELDYKIKDIREKNKELEEKIKENIKAINDLIPGGTHKNDRE